MELRALLEAGRRDEARALAGVRLKKNPHDGEAGVTLAKLELEAGHLEACASILKRLPLAAAASYDGKLTEATLAYASGKPKSALVPLAELTASVPGRPEAHYALGLVHKANGSWALAEKSLHAAIERGPKRAAAQLTLGEVLAAQGKHQQAAHAFAEASRLEPRLEHPYVGLAVLLDLLDRPDEGRAVLEAGLRLLPKGELLARALAALDSGAMRLKSAQHQLDTGLIDSALASCASLEQRGLQASQVKALRAAAARASPRQR